MAHKLLRHSAGHYTVHTTDRDGFFVGQADFSGATAEAVAKKFIHDNSSFEEHTQSEEYKRQQEAKAAEVSAEDDEQSAFHLPELEIPDGNPFAEAKAAERNKG